MRRNPSYRKAWLKDWFGGAAADIPSEKARIERKIEQVVERILAAESPTLIAACQKDVRKMEERRLALSEKAKSGTQPSKTFEEVVRTA